MELFIQYIISSVVQIILFTLLPFIWWLITARKKSSFFEWIGLKKIGNAKENKTFLYVIGTAIAFMVLAVFMFRISSTLETATSGFKGLGLAAVPAVLVYAIFNTALPEEIIFRGFLLKRLSNKFGFGVGNFIQSLIFGLMHGVMFFSVTGTLKALIITLFTGAIGWVMGYVNEKKAEGSIIPSWMIHAMANIFSGLCAAFLIFGA